MKSNYGFAAECFVADGLKASGWKILARNFRNRGFEIDIIALRESLIFVEVKSRKRLDCQARSYESLITSHKKIALKRGADFFLTYKNSTRVQNIRFDLAIVLIQKKIQLIRYHPGFM